MTCNCEQCGTKTDEPMVILWARDMGKLCKKCFDEIAECPPMKVVKSLMPEAERKAMLSKNLEKARATRSKNAQDKRALKEEIRQMKRNENPEEYDRKLKTKLDALQKARETKKLRQEVASQRCLNPKCDGAGNIRLDEDPTVQADCPDCSARAQKEVPAPVM